MGKLKIRKASKAWTYQKGQQSGYTRKKVAGRVVRIYRENCQCCGEPVRRHWDEADQKDVYLNKLKCECLCAEGTIQRCPDTTACIEHCDCHVENTSIPSGVVTYRKRRMVIVT